MVLTLDYIMLLLVMLQLCEAGILAAADENKYSKKMNMAGCGGACL
jgi:sulfur transfer complex TusBCD TusB component (DsrH family)